MTIQDNLPQIQIRVSLSPELDAWVNIFGGVPTHDQLEMLKAHIDLLDKSLNSGAREGATRDTVFVSKEESVPAGPHPVSVPRPRRQRGWAGNRHVLTDEEKQKLRDAYNAQPLGYKDVARCAEQVGIPYTTAHSFLVRDGLHIRGALVRSFG